MHSRRYIPSIGRIAIGCGLVSLLIVPVSALAQSLPSAAPSSQSSSQSTGGQPDPSAGQIRFQLPTVTVTAQKEPEEVQKLPVSVTAVVSDWITNAGIRTVKEASIYAPNTYFLELSARKISNARFRGIGSSPANPGITTFIDGVPQLNANSSSIELTDVQQIEFVRGPQSALFGRNTLGGLVNITSTRPSLTGWTGNLSVPLGNHDEREVRGNFSGPLVADKLAMSVALGYGRRDGYTINDITGNDLDSRSASFGKGQLLWTPTREWEARFIVSGERARDGDYALNDLQALRRSPFHSARDFEGFTNRDLLSTTVLTRRTGTRLVLSTTTGFVNWKTRDLTDLDYSPISLIVRDNTERDFQFTQEVRLASSETAPMALSSNASLKWQSGVFLFTQDYEQQAINTFSPFILNTAIPFPVDEHSPEAELNDFGLGVYGQGTVTINDRLDLVAGARVDYENKEALLDTFFSPPIGAPTVSVTAEESFSNVSPQFAVAYRLEPERMLYATAARGFKAGGFNPVSPPGSEAYGEEHTWHFEGGAKTSLANGRVSANAAAFYIDWEDLQLNVPIPPAQFFITNIGAASSSGVEVEVSARATASLDLFGAFGYTRARFKDGSTSGGLDVSGNKLPNTPEFTTTIGGQYSHAIGQSVIYGRAELVAYGAFEYDDANTEGQGAYSLTNLRVGVRNKLLFVEGWMRNAFDTRYIPIAFPYGSLAPSGFVGEMGAPRTFGIKAGVTF
jgi:iron complex outermembrane receptor protein